MKAELKILPALHTNTEYSFQASTIRIDNLIALAKTVGLQALVITDRNNMFGVFEFIEKCRAAKIKPIVGLSLDVDNFELILLAKNYSGFLELSRLSSMALRKEKIPFSSINLSDLFIIDHPVRGYYAQHQEMLSRHANYFIATDQNLPNALNVAETKILSATENAALAVWEALVKPDLKLTPTAYTPYRYQYEASDLRTAQHEAIVSECNLVFPSAQNYLPVFRTESNLSSPAYLKQLVEAKAHAEHGAKFESPVYQARLKYELEIIERLGFADYFLIIWDIVTWSRKQGIAIGPGRGSAAGSLVVYVLGITEVDPLEFGLLFERFLNPERVTQPDIDIDIQDTRRYDVVRYLYEKYGAQNVAQISTFSTLGAKSAFRDVARVLGLPLRDVNGITKLLPDDLTLREAITKSSKFRALINSHDDYSRVFEYAALLEGLPRQTGTHAAGIVISKTPIEKHFPVTIGTENLNQIQLSMNYLERNGLLKIDLLGLKNLTILQRMQETLFRSYGRKLELAKIPLNDTLTNRLLSEGDTNGVFQLESPGMKATLQRVGVSTFNDLAAIISLFRPGPMDNIPLYAVRKNERVPIPKVDPIIDEITRDTYGIIIYQEQIMQIAQRYANFTFGEADLLRRAIGKKNAEQIHAQRAAFLERAKKRGASPEQAQSVFEIIERFADYGFNKSHAVAYGMLAYRMAYVKARFRFEFYAALFESSIGSQDMLRRYVSEARSNQIVVEAPSLLDFQSSVMVRNRQILLPLSIIKGIGAAAEQKVIEARGEGFVDFFDTVARLKLNSVPESIILTLVQAGTMRAFGNVQTLLDNFPSALRYSELAIIERSGVRKLDPNAAGFKPPLQIQTRNLLDEMNYERQLYGFLLAAFPTENFETAFKLGSLKLNVAEDIVVYVLEVQEAKDRNGNPLAHIRVVDSTTELQMTAFESELPTVRATPSGSVVKARIVLKEYNGRLSYNLVTNWKVLKRA